jgi:hypothetical protein
LEATSKILDKYEKLEKERSVTNIFAIASYKSDQEQKSEINETYVVGLNPTVQDFQPRFKRNFFLSARNEATTVNQCLFLLFENFADEVLLLLHF